MNILTISKKGVRPEVKTLITRVVQEVLYDPDFGLELSERAKRKLNKARASRQKGITLSEIKRKYF